MEKLKRFIKIVSPVLVVGALLALAVVTAFAAENPLAATGVFLAATGSKSIIAASVESTWIAVSGIVLIVSFCGLVASFAQKKKQFYNENGAEEVEKNDSIPYKNSDSKASADRAVVSDENNYVVYDADKAREADFVSASYEKYDAESEDEKFSVVTIEVDEGGEDRVDKVTEVFGVSKPSFKHILDNDKVKATPSKEDIEAAQREVAAAIEAEEAKARAEREKAEKEAAEIEAKRQAEEREKAEKEAAEKE
ncbi:MAG: hypothetical protein LBQ27_05950, partial [Clostridiales bacterium]|nr:hypothetical protein [Clostridiales bacterium]